jgi:hypothetical protein
MLVLDIGTGHKTRSRGRIPSDANLTKTNPFTIHD